MVFITEQLVRKKAEHNELEIFSLEELSLHQENIERIEHLDKWCRELQILYLQSNLIPKIENVGRLKKLKYLNLALNNVEKIENLEGCESLEKLDLTVNFVGEVTSVEHLRDLCHFRELYLTGNPCAQYEGYREYVIAALPQLQILDGVKIEKSERIAAMQDFGVLRARMVQQQLEYKKQRDKEKEAARLEDQAAEEEKKREEKNKPGFDGNWYTDINQEDVEKRKDRQLKELEEEYAKDKEIVVGTLIYGTPLANRVDHDETAPTGAVSSGSTLFANTSNHVTMRFFEETSAFTPESRVKAHMKQEEIKNREKKKEEIKNPPKPPRRLFADDGRPLNVNEAKIDFKLTEDETGNSYILDYQCFKYLETSMIDVDVQPSYVRIKIKGKVFQLCLDQEVNADSSSCKRSQISGHLLVTMPKAKQIVAPPKPKPTLKKTDTNNKENIDSVEKTRSKVEKLEVDESARHKVDIANIVTEKSAFTVPPLGSRPIRRKEERPNSENFVDNPDVPPLE